MSSDDKDDRALATFRSGHELAVERDGENEALLIRAVDGDCVLRIEMTADGPVVRLQGSALEVTAATTLALRAEQLQIEATSANIAVEHDLTLTSRKGGITVDASDDVDVSGERIRLNSPEHPMPLTWDEFRQRQRALKKSDDS